MIIVTDMETSQKSYRERLKERAQAAISAIEDGSFLLAQVALNDCIGYEAVIEELEFQMALEKVGQS